MSDRKALNEALTAMNAAKASPIWRDRCGDSHIGRKAVMFAENGKLYIYFATPSVRHWNNIKNRFSQWKVTQDGDDEGILLIGDKKDLETYRKDLRHALGLRQRQKSDAARHLAIYHFKGGSA